VNTTVDATMDSIEVKKDAQLSAFIRSAFYEPWREKIKAIKGCAQPVNLAGAFQLVDKRTGEIRHDYSGQIMAPCGTRRAALCPSCAARYAEDAFHLIRAGLSGDDSKGVPASVRRAPRLVLTLTAPSFGKVHSRSITKTGKVVPCACGEAHRGADTRVSTPIDPDSYDYEHAVLWHANAGKLWHRFTIALQRRLAVAGGIPVREFKNHAKVSYSKVAEYQKRGMIHFHAIIRVDGPDGPGSEVPGWITDEVLTSVMVDAVKAVEVIVHRPDRSELVLRFGEQVKPEPITVDNTRDGKGEQTLAGYVAKYATKSSGVTDSGVDRRVKSREHIEALDINPHFKRMMLTAWDLGEREQYAHLNLHKWTHMLGFRGHFLTKSKAYSTTFTQLRRARQLHRYSELLTELDVSEDDITVINHWELTSVGHKNDAQRELAAAIANTHLTTNSIRE